MTEPATRYPIAIEGLEKALKHQTQLHAETLSCYTEVYKHGEALLAELVNIKAKREQIVQEITRLKTPPSPSNLLQEFVDAHPELAAMFRDRPLNPLQPKASI